MSSFQSHVQYLICLFILCTLSDFQPPFSHEELKVIFSFHSCLSQSFLLNFNWGSKIGFQYNSTSILFKFDKFHINSTLPGSNLILTNFTLIFAILDRCCLPCQVQIQLDVPKHDPLHDLKMELLHDYFLPTTKDVKGLNNSVNSFIIKLVLLINLSNFLEIYSSIIV